VASSSVSSKQCYQSLSRHACACRGHLALQGDAARFAAYQKQYGNTICGRHPIGVFLNVRFRLSARHSTMHASPSVLNFSICLGALALARHPRHPRTAPECGTRLLSSPRPRLHHSAPPAQLSSATSTCPALARQRARRIETGRTAWSAASFKRSDAREARQAFTFPIRPADVAAGQVLSNLGVSNQYDLVGIAATGGGAGGSVPGRGKLKNQQVGQFFTGGDGLWDHRDQNAAAAAR
jgi:hypothetical protein